MSEESIFSDPHFIDGLIAFLVFDRSFLKSSAHLLSIEDFRKFGAQEGEERRVVAGMALDFWNRYREPLSTYLTVECREFARKRRFNEETTQRLLDYAERLVKTKRIAPEAMLEKVKRFKLDHKLVEAMMLMQAGMEKGTLTTDQFLAIAREAVDGLGKDIGRPSDIFSENELEQRILRRAIQARRQRYPVLLIDPIDQQVKAIARKHLGLVMAPYKRGKSLFLLWVALAYVLQGLNVMLVTLEDPKEDVEDRADAAITALPASRLLELPNRIRHKFSRYRRLIHTKLKIVDGTESQMTVGGIEAVFEQERSHGFTADAVLVDYDDEIIPRKKYDQRRMEFAEIYRDYRAFLARHDLLGWIASQTSKVADELKIVKGKHAAEDISKIRKAFFALSIGQGDWGKDSAYLYVAAHRNDQQFVGANIMMDKTRALFYDREATRKMEKLDAAKAAQQQVKQP